MADEAGFFGQLKQAVMKMPAVTQKRRFSGSDSAHYCKNAVDEWNCHHQNCRTNLGARKDGANSN